MLIVRWQAPHLPNSEQLRLVFEQEGLEATTEEFTAGTKIGEHRHPFTEVRVLEAGEMFFNVAGNQFLMRAGDRLEIPANTKHSFQCREGDTCRSVIAYRVF